MKKLVDEVNVDIIKGRSSVKTEEVSKIINRFDSTCPGVKIDYINKSNIDLKVIDRQGVVVYCPASPEPYYDNGLYIVKTVTTESEYGNRLLESAMTSNNNQKENDYYEIYGPRPLKWSTYDNSAFTNGKVKPNIKPGSDTWYQNLMTTTSSRYVNRKERKTIYFIPASVIAFDKGFYDELTDYLITFAHVDRSPTHPYSILHEKSDYFFEKTKEDSKDKIAFEGYSYHLSEKDLLNKEIPNLYKRSGDGIVRIDPKKSNPDYEDGVLYVNWDELDEYGNIVTKTDSIKVFDKRIPNYVELVLEPWLARYDIFISKDKVKDSHKALDEIYKKIILLKKIDLEEKKVDNDFIKEDLKHEHEVNKLKYQNDELKTRQHDLWYKIFNKAVDTLKSIKTIAVAAVGLILKYFNIKQEAVG